MQCPHQGAKNSTRAGFPERTILSKLEGIRSITSEFAYVGGGDEGPLAKESVAVRPARNMLLMRTMMNYMELQPFDSCFETKLDIPREVDFYIYIIGPVSDF